MTNISEKGGRRKTVDSMVNKKDLELRDEGRRVSIALMTLFQFFSVYSWICVDWIHKSVCDFPFANFYAFLFHLKMVTVFVPVISLYSLFLDKLQ